MTQRGLRVEEHLRAARSKALVDEALALQAEAAPLFTAHVDERKLQKPHLFWKTRVCKSCRNGSKKRLSCPACAGAGRSRTFTFNLGSETQLKDVLYKGLGLPTRTLKGKVVTDEDALRSLLALDKSGIVKLALRYAKLSTMAEIYERLTPAPDGHVRTVFNPAGTYTIRFSSAEAFYIPFSTNLQNLPEQEAKRDPLFAVRDCIVPEPGRVFLYADLSQAEARVVACLSEDDDLLRKWQDPAWDIHRWTAASIFGVPEAQIAKDGPERFLGKKARHALNYGMGPDKFWREVNAVADLTGVSITKQRARDVRDGYLRLHPNLDIVWWNRVQHQVERTHAIVATHCGWRCPLYPRFDPETGALDAETLRAAIAWEPQHTVAHLLNEGLLRVFEQERGAGFKLVHQAHDAVLLDVDPFRVKSVARLVKNALEREIVVNGRKLVIPAEVFVCERNWSEKERVL